jgi:glutathione S-transferase
MAQLTLIIGNKNYSSWSMRPWLLMQHFKIAFSETRISLYTESTNNALSVYFSNGKVPVLIDGDLTVWDSLAICEYVSDAYLDHKAWPADSAARAVARSVCAEMHSSFPALRGEMPMNCRRTPDIIELSAAALADIERIKDIWQKCRNEYGHGGDWLFGEFSIADAMYAPVALRFHSYAIKLDAVSSAYVDSVLQHADVISWMVAGRQESEVIAAAEI